MAILFLKFYTINNLVLNDRFSIISYDNYVYQSGYYKNRDFSTVRLFTLFKLTLFDLQTIKVQINLIMNLKCSCSIITQI